VIQYPYVKAADILVCMSQSGYEKYLAQLKPDGFLLTDKDLVNPGQDREFFDIPSTRMAKELGREMMANIIMVGFMTAVTAVISEKAAKDAVLKSVPKGTEEMNLKAFTKGYDYGLSKLKGRQKKAMGEDGVSS